MPSNAAPKQPFRLHRKDDGPQPHTPLATELLSPTPAASPSAFETKPSNESPHSTSVCGGAWANTAFRILQPGEDDRPADSVDTPAPVASGLSAPRVPSTPRNASHVSSECQPQPQDRGSNSSSGWAEGLPSRCAELLGEQLAEEAWGREDRRQEEPTATAPVEPQDRRRLMDPGLPSRAISQSSEGEESTETGGTNDSTSLLFTVRAREQHGMRL